MCDLRVRQGFLRTGGNAFHGDVDRGQGLRARRDGNVGQVDIDREARHVTDEEIDGGATLKSKATLLRNMGEDAHEQGDLPTVDVTKRHSDPPAR
jgi:hypothetical protein